LTKVDKYDKLKYMKKLITVIIVLLSLNSTLGATELRYVPPQPIQNSSNGNSHTADYVAISVGIVALIIWIYQVHHKHKETKSLLTGKV
jgi:hypothetical protein